MRTPTTLRMVSDRALGFPPRVGVWKLGTCVRGNHFFHFRNIVKANFASKGAK